MPVNVVRTLEDEIAWERANDRAREAEQTFGGANDVRK